MDVRIAIALAAAGFGLGVALTSQHFEPQIAAANERAGELENAYNTLAQTTAHQNGAIEAERAAGESRKAAAIAAAQAAAAAAQPHYQRAGVILGLKTPPGVDPCRAAREAFDDELRKERRR